MIVAISGYAGSGKDEVASIMNDIDPTWTTRKFAGKLKVIASMLTGIPESSFENQLFKDSEMSSEWDRSFYHGEKGWIKRPMNVREFLQLLGTDAIRTGLHHNTWVNSLMSEYVHVKTIKVNGTFNIDTLDEDNIMKELKKFVTIVDEYPNWVITDCRFKNEAEAVKLKGGFIVRVNRPGVNPINNHDSEVELDNYHFDYVINNDGSLYDLRNKVKALIDHISQHK